MSANRSLMTTITFVEVLLYAWPLTQGCISDIFKISWSFCNYLSWLLHVLGHYFFVQAPDDDFLLFIFSLQILTLCANFSSGWDRSTHSPFLQVLLCCIVNLDHSSAKLEHWPFVCLFLRLDGLFFIGQVYNRGAVSVINQLGLSKLAKNPEWITFYTSKSQ